MLISDERLVMTLGPGPQASEKNHQNIQEMDKIIRVEMVTIKDVDTIIGNLRHSR